jgi:hypothetical protein
MYSAVAGAAGASLVSGGAAEAEPVAWSPPEGLPVVIDESNTYYSIDLDGDGSADVNVWSDNAYGGTFAFSWPWDSANQLYRANTSYVWDDDKYFYVRRVEGRRTIGWETFRGIENDRSATTYLHVGGGDDPNYGGAWYLPYTAFQGSPGYVAIRLNKVVDIYAQAYFGYLRIIVNDEGDTLTLLGGAYDDQSNRAIETPEPGALASLAASALTLAGLRRRARRRSRK